MESDKGYNILEPGRPHAGTIRPLLEKGADLKTGNYCLIIFSSPASFSP